MKEYLTIPHTDRYGNTRNAKVFATFETDGGQFAVIARRVGNYDSGAPFQVVPVPESGIADWGMKDLDAALGGDLLALSNTVIFDRTAEGHSFWADQTWHSRHLSNEGRKALLAVKNQFQD